MPDEEPRGAKVAQVAQVVRPAQRTQVVMPPRENKEGIEMNRGNKPSRIEPLYCPVCPGGKANVRGKEGIDLVCGDCYRLFVNDAAIALAQGKVIHLFDWVAAKAPALVATLKQKCTLAEAEINRIEKEVVSEASADIEKKAAGDPEMTREIRIQAFQLKRRELWRAKDGDAKYARKKEAETRIVLLNTVLAKAKAKEAAEIIAGKPAEPAVVNAH